MQRKRKRLTSRPAGVSKPQKKSSRATNATQDVDAGKIKALAEKANQTKARKVEGFVSNTTPLPLPDEYATKILAPEMLEHTSNPGIILAELVRVGKSGAQYLNFTCS
jgi:ubiquinone/menaquinone biosynthesis C-methylase UbiE